MTTTLRLPDELGIAVKAAAKEHGTTVNELVRSLVARYLRDEEERKLYNGFTRLGDNAAASDVEFAMHAAAEVVLSDE